MSDPNHKPLDLAVAITACNSMRTIERTLRSVQGLHRKLVVIDSGSTDGTIELCRHNGAEVIHRPWHGNVLQKRFAIDQCMDCTWTLVLDSDESLEPSLRDSIRSSLQNDADAFDGWMMNRKVHFLGGWLHHTFQPEWRMRLFRTPKARMTGREPHDSIEVDGPVGRLKGDLRHDSWADLQDMLQRYITYGKKTAEMGASGGNLRHILFNPQAALFKQFIVKQGFRDGWRGLVAAGGAAAGVMIKHIYVAQHRAELKSGRSAQLLNAIPNEHGTTPPHPADRSSSA